MFKKMLGLSWQPYLTFVTYGSHAVQFQANN